MRLVTVSFNYPPRLKRPDYAKLLEVFEKSIHHHMPHCEVRSIKMDPPDHSGVRKLSFLSNMEKLQVWAREAQQAVDDGVDLILADCDMVCVGDASHVFDENDFDIAYTVRNDHTNLSVNGGVVYVRPTEATRHFFQRWTELDQQFYYDWNLHAEWRIRYGGMNQASFGYLLEKPEEQQGARLKELPTLHYNAVNYDWPHVGSKTVFIHIKSDLRKAVLTRTIPGELTRSEGSPHRSKALRRAPAMKAWYAEAGIKVSELKR